MIKYKLFSKSHRTLPINLGMFNNFVHFKHERNDSIDSTRKFGEVPGLLLMLIQACHCFCLIQFVSQTGRIMTKSTLARADLYHREIRDLDWSRKSTGSAGVRSHMQDSCQTCGSEYFVAPSYFAKDTGCRK